MFKRLLLITLLGISPVFTAVCLQAQEAATAVSPVAAVNINQADAKTLAQALVGIGITKAEAIIAYRESFGSFATVDELLEVRGVGPAILAKNRHRITLQ